MLEVKRNVINCKDIVKLPSYLSLGTHPVKYLLGMSPLVDMLVKSIDPGRFRTFAKLDTFSSSWKALSTVCKAYIKGVLEGDSLGYSHRINTVLAKCSTQIIWCEVFNRGVDMRVRSKSKPYQAVNIEVMKLLLDNMYVLVEGKVSML